MAEHKFIISCKNYNLRSKTGVKYNTVVNKAMTEINKIQDSLHIYCLFDTAHDMDLINNESKYTNKKRTKLMNKMNKQKFKMCVHKLKLSLPNHIVYNIGSFL